MLWNTMKYSSAKRFGGPNPSRFLCKRATLALLLSVLATPPAAVPQEAAKGRGLEPIRSYIAAGWDTLTRSQTDCNTIVNPKLASASVLYVPADLQIPETVQQMQKRCNVQVKHLPEVIHQLGEVYTSNFEPAGLLYLENKYVVPGGRFNEMYGWDSYFIIRGLVEDGRTDLARGMVENFFFEIENYGALLNANRTYYLTRSQPPFLSSMVLAVYDAEKQAGRTDTAWLARGYPYLEKDYFLWTRDPHLAGPTGLARYYDFC